MSTYLVAFVVSGFQYEFSPPTGNNVTFRIWAQDSALDQISYAKSIGAEILRYFETYFNVPYPLPKQVIPIGICKKTNVFSCRNFRMKQI